MAMQRSVAAAVLLAAGMLALLWSPQPASGEVGSPGDGFDAITDGNPPVDVPFFGEPVIVPGEHPQEARPKPPEARPKPQAGSSSIPRPSTSAIRSLNIAWPQSAMAAASMSGL